MAWIESVSICADLPQNRRDDPILLFQNNPDQVFRFNLLIAQFFSQLLAILDDFL